MSTARSSTQDTRSAADDKRRKRKERSAKSRTPEPKDIVSGAGQPLDPGVRRELEEQLGHDFSQVRLHTDRDSGQLAEMMGADAFAVGQDIFFRAGTYRPGTADGQRLLAHELLHTVQNPHGLGALRAGRDLGSVSLPQESVEREAESAAQASVLGALRDSVREEEPAAEVRPGQATPGWLRYATVDADRSRMEKVDPATLVDRLTNGVLRSLRGDPEDRSGRVRLQLARMAPQVQESVLDRLEIRLSTPELDRLLDLVEEVAEGPLPPASATAPEAVPDEAEVLGQERAQEAAAARDKRRADEKESDGRRKRAQQRKDADPAGDGGPERDGRQTAGGAAKASAAAGGTAASGQSAAQAKEAAGARQGEQAQAKEDDKAATGQAARQDNESAAGGQGEDSPEQSEEQAGEQDGQSTGGERAEDAGEGGTGPEAVDKSAAEPGEKDRKGGDRDGQPGSGDLENEEDADDEPLGLEEESADLDEDDEEKAEQDADGDADAELEPEDDEDDADADADAADSPSDGELNGSAPSAARRGNQKDSGGREGDGHGAPGVIDSPATEDPTAALREADGGSGSGGGARPSEEEQESDDRIGQDLQTDKSIEQEIGPEPDEQADDKVGEESGDSGSDSVDPDDAELEREQAEERTEDAEAKRRDDAARTASEGSGGSASGSGGDTAASGQLSKADEDARKQAAGSSSASNAADAASGSGAGAGAGSGEGKSSEGSPDTGPKPSAGSGERSGTGSGSGSATASGTEGGSAAGSASGTAAGKDESREAGGTASGGSGKSPDDAASMDATASKDATDGKDAAEPAGATETKDAARSREVTEGKGPATVPGPEAGPDQAPGTGPSAAPTLSPGKGAAVPMAATVAKGGAPKPEPSAKPEPGRPAVRPKAGAAPRQRQAARQAARTVRRGGGGGGGGRTAAAPARGGGGGRAASGPAKAKKDAPTPDVSKSTPEAGLATVSKLKPYQMLETFKGVDGAVGNSVGKERTALHKGPPTMARPIGSPRTVPGGPTPAAPGTYTHDKVARTDAAKGKTDEITGEQRPEGEAPGADVPEPSWWDILLTIGGALLKKIFPFDDLIDSVMGIETTDDGMKGNRVGNAPGLPLQDDSDPQRTEEQGQKLDERKDELHRSGREDAAKPMGEDQIYPDAPQETLTAKVRGGGKQVRQKGGGAAKGAGGGVPVESASAVAEHDRGPQIQAGFARGHQRMAKERGAKDDKATADKQKHDQDVKREVDAGTKKQAGEREKGRDQISDARDKWRKEQDDKVTEIDDKKGKKYDKVRKDVDDKQKETDDKADKRTEDDNNKIDNEHANAQKGAEQKKDDKKKEAEKGDGGFLDQLKQWWENLKNEIKKFFEQARKAVTDLIDKFKKEVFQLIDDARNWVVKQINDFADALIAFGDEMLADYPAMRDKWRNTINAGRDYAVRKVNEAADALKEVAGKLIDGLGGALLAGLDMMESGLLAAVEVAESVTVSAVEFGQAVVAGLGEWAAIFTDIVSDPGGWISKAGSAAHSGARDYLFDEVKSAVKEWFNNKVQEITGLSPEDFQALISGNVSVEEMGKMAWDAAVPQLPMIIGELVIEKVVAKLIPGAGWVMAIIDALKTAWDTLSEILAAFGLFMDFLKAVKSGNGARPFAKAVAAGVVALLELIYQALIDGLNKYMGKVTSKLGEMLKNIRGKRRPGGHGEPGDSGSPGRNSRPGHPDSPGHANTSGPAGRPGHADKPGPTADKPGPADKPNQRPAPRKPSPDKTSRPEEGPRPTKHPSPEKKPRPEHQPQPKHKKKPDEHERRDDGREVNDARRRLRDAKRKQRRDDDKPAAGKRRGPARDTLRKKRPDQKRDQDRTKDPLHKKDPRKPDLNKKHDDKGHHKDRTRDKDGKKKVSTRKRPPRKPESRTRRTLRRARQTIKSALSRARRAARRLFGKGRKLGHKLNNRAHRLRDRWRRQRDRLRRRHERRRNHDRDRRRDPDSKKDYDLPKVHFRTKAGEMHTLLFSGRGRSAGLAVRSRLDPLQTYFNEWQDDNKKIKDSNPDMFAEQESLLKQAKKKGDTTDDIQNHLPEKETRNPRTGSRLGSPISLGSSTDANFSAQMASLQISMEALADLLAQRYSEADKPPLPPTILPPFSDGTVARSFKASYIKKSTPAGSEANDRPDAWPLGWDKIVQRNLAINAAWVRMHMLTAVLGGESSTSNLAPARGTDNIDAREKAEHPAARSLGKAPGGRGWSGSGAPNEMIWYDVDIAYWQDYPGFPSSVVMRWGGYHHPNGSWARISAGGKRSGSWSEGSFAKPPWDANSAPHAIANINRDDAQSIHAATRVNKGPAKTIVSKRKQEPGQRFDGMEELKAALLKGVKSDRLKASREKVIELLEAAEASGRLIF
ncbi:eCIS core domain-containing protein [Streptomyces sp. NPDC054786]